jgi:hypothetical protein
MTFNEIETAIGQRLEGMTDCPPIAWPNKDFTPNGTYLEFRHAPNERRDDVISGGYPFQIGIALITVVTARDSFTTTANGLAQDIADRFPKALRLTAGSGNVVINAPANLGNGFVDGVYWRQPVSISYITEG